MSRHSRPTASPPSPNTSTRAAPLHVSTNKHWQRSSLPFVAVLNPFRRKPPRKPQESLSPPEPYEVAPGIWSTDATAQVFGYLEPTKSKKSQGKSLSLGSRNPGQIPKKKPVDQSDSQRSARNPSEKHHAKDVNNDRNQNYVELPGHPNENEKDIERFLARHQEKDSKGRMRTVSKDDQLIQRGANPRTGLVSPFVVSDSSDENVSRDYVNVAEAQMDDRPVAKGRSRSGKWKQRGAGWSLVESPTLSPIAQSTHDPISRKVSVQNLEDKLLVQMPGVDNPEPNNMTDEQMRRYQNSVARIFKRGGSGAMVDPDTLPSPRPLSPEGPSTPPKKLHRIKRKEVCIGPGRQDESSDTVIVGAQKQGSSVPAQSIANQTTSSVKIGVPSPTLKAEDRTIITDESFLGRPNQLQLSQKKDITHSKCLPIRALQETHLQLEANVHVDPQASPTLSQYLPLLHLLHPSHFANLGTSSYRRPAHLLPERLRHPNQQEQAIEHACTTTTTSTMNRKLESQQRPKLQRKEGSSSVPRSSSRSPQKCRMPKENYLQAGTLRKKSSFVIKPMVDESGSDMTKPKSTRVPGMSALKEEMTEAPQQLQTLHKQYPPGTAVLTRSREKEAEQGARAAMMENHRYQPLCQPHLEKGSRMVSANQGLKVGSVNVIQRDRRDGAGIIPTFAHLGRDCGSSGCSEAKSKGSVVKGTRTKIVSDMPTEMAFSRDNGAWFTGQWTNGSQEGCMAEAAFTEPTGELSPGQSMLTRIADGHLPLGYLVVPVQLKWAQQQLYQMASHVVQTLHPKSLAVTVLKSPNVRAEDYLVAAKEVIIAGAYLVVLLNALLLLQKVLVLMGAVLFWMWYPVRTFITVLRWCIQA